MLPKLLERIKLRKFVFDKLKLFKSRSKYLRKLVLQFHVIAQIFVGRLGIYYSKQLLFFV